MNITISEIRLHRINVRTRMPFRYGIATMTDLPHLFVEVVLGRSNARGLAADHLPPKWFTKDPDKPVGEEIDEMLRVIRNTAEEARCLSGATFFEIWKHLYSIQTAWAAENGVPPLLGNFGTSLVERALLDALCRNARLSLREMLRRDLLGLRLNELDSDLPPHAELKALPARPSDRIVLRHTVGIGDPLNDEDIRAGQQLNDGLPQSLVAAVRTNRLRHFKIKIQATEESVERFDAILACLEQHAPAGWRYTLDANESFQSPHEFRVFWERLAAGNRMRRNLPRLLFVEQPIRRNVTFEDQAGWRKWPERPLLIIDEADDDLSAGKRALGLGYDGMSHKNCKGVVKGILNRTRIAAAQSRPGGRPVFMSGEDLSNIGPVALPQDLAVQAILGNQSVERNGYHYFRGVSMFPESLQHTLVDAHPDLYTWHPSGFAHLRIEDGLLSTRSVLEAPFGYNFDFDPSSVVQHRE